ncbi:hypothetical protein GCM10023144_17720 [Pigmentiphaga soli]|uniref:Rieske domain-containing protein n=1 Tax=Pigmentiphaga soli TaxID=1007095 RepID=A0ABP8GUR3_9BURK
MDKEMAARPLLSERELQALFKPIGVADGLPGRVYSDQACWDVEREKLFRQDWFAVGFASDAPMTGDLKPITAAGWELVLIRQPDGSVRCFHNICRHRGTKLVREARNVRKISCGWHCWTYELDGRLNSTPLIAGPRTTGHEDFDRAQLGLIEVRSAVWNDIVFVNIDGKARSFEDFSARLTQLFARYEPAGYDLAHPSGGTEEAGLDINWKLYHEGGLEGYHIPFVHPALSQPAMYKTESDDDVFTSVTAGVPKYTRLGTLAGLAADALGLNPAAAAAIARGEDPPYTICFVTPTVIVAAWPEAFITTLLRPVSATRTTVRRKMYFIGPGATSTQAAPARQRNVDIWEQVTSEDAAYSMGVQSLSAQRQEIGMSTRFSPYWEDAVHHFQQIIARRAYGAAAAA